MVVAGLVTNAVTTVQFSQAPLGDVDLTECLVKLHAAIDRVHSGDLRDTEIYELSCKPLAGVFVHAFEYVIPSLGGVL